MVERVSDYDELLGLGAAPDATGHADLPADEVRASLSAGRAISGDVIPGDTAMRGGAYEAAERYRQLAHWNPVIAPANDEILPEKGILDARTRDVLRNDGYVASGARLHRDHIVGHHYLLNAKPETKVLFGREDEIWETEFQEEVETKFSLWAESPLHWPDAARSNTLTSLVRLGVSMFSAGGEVLASAEWMPADGRPFRSAILMLDPDRLCNPNGNEWLPNIKGGIERDRRGAPIAYHILDRHPNDYTARGIRFWRRVMARKPNWGRPQILHIFEQLRPDQARGIAAMTAALAEMRMTKEFRQVELQRAVVAATYAASIESDLPAGDVYSAMGSGEANPSVEWAAQYLGEIAQYQEAAKGLSIDGVKIPVFMPGTHLKLQTPGNNGPLGADFETSLLRHIAAVLGVSYEQLSRDFSKTNYSSARAAMGETLLHMQAIKKLVADGVANFIYRLWLEEAINTGALESTKGRRMPSFYEGLNAEAYSAAEWIGAGQGQMDPLKETQAAALRLRTQLTTQEIEIARIHGADWRRVMRQIARERALAEKLDIPSVYETEPTDAENAATGEPREISE